MLEHNFINYYERDNVAILELDDPSANTLTFHLLKELEEKSFHIAANSKIRGIVLIGKGDKFFSGGVNIGMLLTAGKQHNSHFILYAAEVLEFIESLPIPVVTIINGNITGGGLELALIADYRIAIAGEYNIGFPEVRLGVIPGMGGTQRLARLVGPQRALEMITQGEFISPAKSKKIGLVDTILEVEDFRENAIQDALAYIHKQHYVEHPHLSLANEYKTILTQQIVSLEINNGLACISVNRGAEKYSCIDLLFAINEFVLELRTDDSIYCLLIDIKAESFGANDTAELYEVHKLFTRYLVSKLSGYPRIVALNIGRALGIVEFELALHCDYRFITSELTTSSVMQKINTDSTELARYVPLFDNSNSLMSLAELFSAGFFKYQDELKTWLYRFVPPTGAGQAIGYAKLAITKGYKEPISSSLLLERHLQEQLFMSHDSKEGMKAYIEKRKPFFIGV